MADMANTAAEIRAAVSSAGGLRNLPKGQRAPEFVAWHNQISELLKRSFGEESPQYQTWVRRSYQPPHLAATPSEFKVYFVRGLDGATRQLNQILQELGG